MPLDRFRAECRARMSLMEDPALRMARSGWGSFMALDALVIHRFLRDHDVVSMAFFQATSGDPNERGLGAEFLQRFRPEVTHAGTETADKLENHIAQRTAEWHAAFHAFCDQFARGILSIAIT